MTATSNDSNRLDSPYKKSGMALSKRLLLLTRTLHIYLSMLALLLLLFFSITGFMMNHAEWFGIDSEQTTESAVTIPTDLAHPAADAPHPDLALVEYLRSNCGARGQADMSFHMDDNPIMITFKGPHFRYDASIDTADGKTTITQTKHSFSGFLGNLHKGADTGQTWHRIIDSTSILLAFISLSGLVLWLSLAKRRTIGLIAVGICVVGCAAVFFWFLP